MSVFKVVAYHPNQRHIGEFGRTHGDLVYVLARISPIKIYPLNPQSIELIVKEHDPVLSHIVRNLHSTHQDESRPASSCPESYTCLDLINTFGMFHSSPELNPLHAHHSPIFSIENGDHPSDLSNCNKKSVPVMGKLKSVIKLERVDFGRVSSRAQIHLHYQPPIFVAYVEQSVLAATQDLARRVELVFWIIISAYR